MAFDLLIQNAGTRAAEALNIRGHVLREGGNADLVVLNAASVWEAIWTHEAPRHVIKNGVEITQKT